MDVAVAAPTYSPDRRITLVPSDLPFPTARVREAVEAVDADVHVLVYAEVGDAGDAGYSSATERVIEEVWDAWAVAPGEGPRAFDPAEDLMILLALDEREVRVRTGSRLDAELGLGGRALLPVIDRHFLPRARAGDLDAALAALVRGLEREVERRERSQQHQQQIHALLLILPWMLAAVLLISLAIVALVAARHRASRARRRFQREAGALTAAVTQARDNLAGLQLDVETRDQVVALKLKGPRTVALVEEVREALAEIHAGLGALERRVAEATSTTRGAAPLAVAPWTRALAQLDEPLVIDTGEAQRRLFDLPTRVVEVPVEGFRSQLDARFEEAAGGWQRVRDAVAASLSRARDDLTPEDLDGMRARLAEAALPAHWVRSHPLLPDAEAAWARLDALRVSDPVAYLDALDDAFAEDDALEAVVAELIGARAAVEQAWADAAAACAAAEAHDTAFVDSELLPARVAAAAERAVEALRVALQGEDLGLVRASADAALGRCEALARHAVEIAEAVSEAAGKVEAAEAEIDELAGRRARKSKRLAELLAVTAPEATEGALEGLSQAAHTLTAARTSAGRARELLERRAHLEAARTADEAIAQAREASVALDGLVASLEVVEADRQAAERLRASLDAERATAAAALMRYGAPERPLEQGDALRAEAEPRWQTEQQVDWAGRVVELERIILQWHGAVRIARLAHERAEQERRDQLQRERAVAAAAAAAWSGGRSSTYRSTTSRPSS